jgi:hypothetical protein
MGNGRRLVLRSNLERRRTIANLNYQVMSILVLKVRALSKLIMLYLTQDQ